MITLYFYLLVIIFGLIIGSFLNALIFRLHSGESIADGRSLCPHCRHTLAWFDLLPVVSFLWLRGRCRYCQRSISWQYPVVEAITAILFLAFYLFNVQYYNFGWPLLLVCLRDWLVVSALIVVFVYDFRWMLIPDSVVLPVIVLAASASLFLGQSLAGLFLSLVIGFGFFALQYYVSGGTWIGGGDLRLGLLLGAVLTWPSVILALFLAYIFGAIVGVGLLLTNKVNRKTEIPFGVFIVPAMIIAMLWGQAIITWYLSLL